MESRSRLFDDIRASDSRPARARAVNDGAVPYPMSVLVFRQNAFTEVRRRLLADAPLEAACFLLATSSDIGEGLWRLIVGDIVYLEANDYVERSEWSVELTARVLADVTKRARLQQLSVFLVHSHPVAARVQASDEDRRGERKWVPAVTRRAPGVPHGRLILGPTDQSAALLTPEGVESPLRVIEVGEQLVDHSGSSQVHLVDESRNDRQIRAFGVDGQRQLARMHVGVIGVGGTGSIVTQQLAHLGVGEYTLLDPDVIEWSNLNRIVGATPGDVGRSKTDVAAGFVSRIQPDAPVHTLQADVRDAVTARRLLACDFLFCCTDSEGSRAVVNQLAYQYCLPVIDLGVIIVAKHGTVSHISGRVQLLAPGEPCLLCGSVLDPEQVRRDLLTEEARKRDQYIVGNEVIQPAVISINGATASLAVTMMLATVTGIPVAARNQRLRLEAGLVSRLSVAANPDCPICSAAGALGRGDAFTFPGRR